MSPEKRPDRCHHHHSSLLHFSLFEMRRTRRQANERARGQRLWRNGRNEPARQAARPPRPAAPPSTSRKAAAGGRRKLASSCDSELRLQPQLDTPGPYRAPWGVAPATPRTNWCVSCAAALSSPSSSSSLWALTKLALSCGFSRSYSAVTLQDRVFAREYRPRH